MEYVFIPTGTVVQSDGKLPEALYKPKEAPKPKAEPKKKPKEED